MGNKKWWMAVIVAYMALVLSGCSESASKDVSTNTEKIQLKFFGHKLGAEEGNMPQIIADFEAKNSDIDIEYEAIPTSNGYADVIKARLAARDTTDIFMGNVSQTEIYLNAGYIEDLSDQPWVEGISDSVKNSIKQNDKYYLLPLENSVVGLFSNSKILEANGIEIPSNWQEFLDACSKVKSAGITPIVMGDKTGWSSGRLYFQEGGNMAVANPNLGRDIAQGLIKPSEALISGIQKYETLAKNGYTNGDESLGMQWNDQALTEFIGGQYAFYFGGSWLESQIKEADETFEYQFSPIPTQDQGLPNAYILTGSSLFVNKDSKYKQQAKMFLEFWAQPENINGYTISQNGFSSMKNGENAESPNARLITEAFNDGRTCIFPNGLEFANNLIQPATKGMQMILMGTQTVEQVGEDMDQALEKAITLKK